MRLLWTPLLFGLICGQAASRDVAPSVSTPLPGQVLVSGTVPDEASKAAILARVREVYGAEKVVDQLSIGSVILPANWNAYVQKVVSSQLKLISRGQLKIDGTTVAMQGEVANEAQRQQIASSIATSLNSTYTINNRLRVSVSEQGLLDQALANRIVEFNSNETNLTPQGKLILDEMAPVLAKLKDRKVEIIGHTDNQGLRASNISLSRARADSVKAYLAAKGISTDNMTTSGEGPDRPATSNDSVEGRSRNRRIEFRIGQ